MTKRKTKKVRFRIRKYRRKLRPREINLAFKENVEFYSANLKDYLRLDNLLEKEALELLEENVKAGIIPKEQKDLYLAFWRKVREEGQKYSSLTLENSIEELINEFVTRGLVKEKLLEIVELVKDQLPRKKLFEQLKEWAVLQDYLKLKVIAYIIPPYGTIFELIPITGLEFRYGIFVLTTRVIPVKPKTLLEFKNYIITILPTLFNINLVNKTRLHFLYEITRLLTFRFSLYPKTKVFFDYDLLVPYFRKFQIKPYVYLDFTYYTLAPITQLFTINVYNRLSFSCIVSPLPTRTFKIEKFYKVSFIYYVPPPYLLKYEITPLPRLVFSVETPPKNTNLVELKPKVSLQFSYTITPA